MTTRNMIWLMAFAGGMFAAYKGDIAAVYIAVAWGSLATAQHAMEIKINKLLDDRDIPVVDWGKD